MEGGQAIEFIFRDEIIARNGKQWIIILAHSFEKGPQWFLQYFMLCRHEEWKIFTRPCGRCIYVRVKTSDSSWACQESCIQLL